MTNMDLGIKNTQKSKIEKAQAKKKIEIEIKILEDLKFLTTLNTYINTSFTV